MSKNLRRLFSSIIHSPPCPSSSFPTFSPSTGPSTLCRLFDIGRSDYAAAWKYQRSLVECHLNTKHTKAHVLDSVIITEHNAVYTLGKGSTLMNLKLDMSDSSYPSVIRIERGGEVTWHGPGMLMVYPVRSLSPPPLYPLKTTTHKFCSSLQVLDLSRHKKSLRWYVQALEEVVIRTLVQLDIKGERSSVNNGVWVGSNKISAVGVSVSRWVSFHGIALNIDCDMTHFNKIVPCGIADPGMCIAFTFATIIIPSTLTSAT